MSSDLLMSEAHKTISKIDAIFKKNEIVYWLEAGTALAAYRDGRIFSWEHDIDIAIWKDDQYRMLNAVSDFKSIGCKVIIQKGMPFVDNIIQIYLPLKEDGSKPFPSQIDVYLYTIKDDFAYMRWLQKPEGRLNRLHKTLFNWIILFVNGKSSRYGKLISQIPLEGRLFLFKFFLKLHVSFSSCIFHRFPKHFFINLKDFDFYGVKVKIAEDTENYLAYRYGETWNKPDENFNQANRWRSVKARVNLKMNILPLPQIDTEVLRLNDNR